MPPSKMMHTSLRERIVKPVDKNLRLQTFLDANLKLVDRSLGRV